MPSLAIDIHNLTFSWHKKQPDTLKIPILQVPQGERIFIYGPSGSGKSTLLALLGGILTPQQGSIKMLGQDLTQLSASARDQFRVDHIGFIFQQFNLIPYLSIIDNVLLPCEFSKRRRQQALNAHPGESLTEQAKHLLQALDLHPSLWSKSVSELSVGQQQRVAAARAFIGKPEIIIADEPTSSLDANRQARFLELMQIECIHNQSTLLYVSHDQRLTEFFHEHISIQQVNKINDVKEDL